MKRIITALAVLAASSVPALAQGYPAKPIVDLVKGRDEALARLSALAR